MTHKNLLACALALALLPVATHAWYKAFNVKPGEKLYLAPEDRVRIW